MCSSVLTIAQTLQVLNRLIAYARSSANLLAELVKGNEDDTKWLV